MKKRVYFILIITSISLALNAQEQKDNYRFQIGFVPHYFSYNAVKTDVEYILKKHKHHLQISPIFFYKENEQSYSASTINNSSTPDYEKLSGAGLGLNHKIYLNKAINSQYYVFLGYGTEYARLNLKYQAYDWTSYQENGLEYYSYELMNVTQDINRIIFQLYIGLQVNLFDFIYISGSLGSGGVYSNNSTTPNLTHIPFRANMYDYGYTGIYFPFSFTFGVRI